MTTTLKRSTEAKRLATVRRLFETVGPACDLSVIHGDELEDEDGEVVANMHGPRSGARAQFVAVAHNEMIFLLELAEEALRLRAGIEREASALDAEAAGHLDKEGREYLDDAGPLLEEAADRVRALVSK
jgi:hypothetical protein